VYVCNRSGNLSSIISSMSAGDILACSLVIPLRKYLQIHFDCYCHYKYHNVMKVRNVYLLQIRLHLIAIKQYVQMGSVILNLCEVTSTTFTKWSALHLEYCKCCRWTMLVRHWIPCNCGVHGWKICIKVLKTKYLDFVDEVRNYHRTLRLSFVLGLLFEPLEKPFEKVHSSVMNRTT